MNESDNGNATALVRRRSVCDRLLKYIVDPRRISHKYLLQFLLCLFLSGPTFFDNFFNACATDIMTHLDISHEDFSLLISIPSITGILCGAVAGIVSVYGSTVTALGTAVVAFVGEIMIAYGIRNSSFRIIMIGRFVFVLCWNLLGSVQKVIIFRQFTGPSLAWVFGLKILAIRIGAVSGLYFAGDIINASDGSLGNSMLLAVGLSAISLLCTLAFAYLYRGSSAARLIRPLLIGRRRNRAGSDPPSSHLFSNLAIPRDTWVCVLIIFFYYGGLVPFETFGVDYLVTEYGMTRTTAGQALALIPFFSFFSPLVSPLITSVRSQVMAVLVAQLLVAASITFETISLPYAPYLYLCVMGIGHMVVANAVWLALAGVSQTETSKTNAASVSSAVYALSTFGSNWITGRVRDSTGNYDVAMRFLACLILLGAIVCFYLYHWGEWRQRTGLASVEQFLLMNMQIDSDSPDNSTARDPDIANSTTIDEQHFLPR